MRKSVHRYLPSLSLFILLFLGNAAQAGNIMLVPKIESRVAADFIDVNLVINNYGDEDSLVVTPTLHLGNQQIHLKEVPVVPFSNFYHWHYRFGRKACGLTENGVYPLMIRVAYHDANMYPYSMVEVTEVPIGENEIDKAKKSLTGKISYTDGGGRQQLTATLGNPSDHPLAGNLTLFLPLELTTENPKTKFTLAAGESRGFDFSLLNMGALPGSRYKIFGVALFAGQGVNRSTVFFDMVSITESAVGTQKSSQILAGIAFLFFLFLCAVLIELKGTLSDRHAA